MSATELELDVRGLPPCEPMDLVLKHIQQLGAGQRLRALISREPVPLYELLAQRGYAWRVASLDDERCELLIWRSTDAAAAPGP